jgi:rhomboid family GlyGly-CTERM serine protease
VHSETARSINAARTGRPWFALAISLLCVAGWFFPKLRDALLYDRDLIAGGQWWRAWSGHFAHHSASHLGWNLAVFLPAAIWLERIRPASARWFFAIGPLFISGVLWWLDPDLRFYAGLSGLTMGVLTLLILLHLRKGTGESRQLGWWLLLVLVGVKIAFEFRQPATALFAGLPEGIRNVPLAHLAGAICAGLFAFTSRKEKANA